MRSVEPTKVVAVVDSVLPPLTTVDMHQQRPHLWAAVRCPTMERPIVAEYHLRVDSYQSKVLNRSKVHSPNQVVGHQRRGLDKSVLHNRARQRNFHPTDVNQVRTRALPIRPRRGCNGSCTDSANASAEHKVLTTIFACELCQRDEDVYCIGWQVHTCGTLQH